MLASASVAACNPQRCCCFVLVGSLRKVCMFYGTLVATVATQLRAQTRGTL